MIQKLLPTVVALATTATLLAANAACAQESAPKSLSVLNYLTGWVHDAAGYHPSVFMLLENTSGRDLSNTLLRFQARFTDLRTEEPTIGRRDLRRELKPHQQFTVSLMGSEPYELPYEVQMWPHMESKVMCRVGDVGDEGTQTLLIAKVQSEARAEDETFVALNQMSGYTPKTSLPARAEQPLIQEERAPRRQPAVEKPLTARAGSWPAKRAADQGANFGGKPGRATPASVSSSMALLQSKSLPGLGEDFYNFEQKFGLPLSTDAKHSDWTWAKYRHNGTGTEFLAGSRERSGKVDMIIVRVPRDEATSEAGIVAAGRQLSGIFKSKSPSAPVKSVRYLPSGRLEMMTSSAPGYRVVCMAPSLSEPDNSYVLVVSRLPQDVEPLLASLSRKSTLLKSLSFLDSGSDH